MRKRPHGSNRRRLLGAPQQARMMVPMQLGLPLQSCPPLTTDWRTVLISAGAAILGGLLSGVFPLFWTWYSRPRIRLDFGKIPDLSHVHQRKQEDGQAVHDQYIRVRLRNTGKEAANDCLVYLTSVQEIHEGGSKVPTLMNEATPLSWPLNEYGSRTIPPGPDFYVDLVRFFSRAPGWHFGMQNSLSSHEPLKSYRGAFRCHVMASARNAKPARLWIDVKYEGTSQSVRVLDSGPDR